RRPRVVGEQRPLEHVAVIRPQRIRAGADGVADRVRAFRAPARRSPAARPRGFLGGRLVERPGGPRLTFHTAQAHLHGTAALAGRVVLLEGQSAEDWQDNQPAVGELVVTDHSVAVVEVAELAEAPEDVAGVDRAVEHITGRVELFA